MDLKQAIKAHEEWRQNFRCALIKQERLDAITIGMDNCCDLGRWLYGDAKTQLGKLSSYRDTVAKHKSFHLEAGKVASAISSSQYVEAEKLLSEDSAFSVASNAVVMAIIQLEFAKMHNP